MKRNIFGFSGIFYAAINVVWIYLFIPSIFLNAQYQDLHFEHLTTDNGLSKSSITTILQDSQGFIWVGTFNGLNRYDGYEFTVYQYDQNNQQSISHNYISSMIEDDDGKLWIGTSDGLNCHDKSTNTFKRYRHDPQNPSSITDNQIDVVFKDKKKRLWIGTRNGGLDLFDRSSQSFVHHVYDKNNSNGLSSNSIHTIFEDSKGNLWIGHRNGAIDVFNDKENKFYHILYNGKKLTGNTIMAIVETGENNIWVGTQGDGLFKIEYENGKPPNIFHYTYNTKQKNSLSGNIILSLMVDRAGKLWIGTEDNGLDILDIQRDKFYYYKTEPLDRSSLNNNSIYTIYEDAIGNIWIGTYAGGINLYVKDKAYFQSYHHVPGSNNSLIDNIVNGFWEDENQNIWIATGGGGLDLLDRKNKKFIHSNNGNSKITAGVILNLYGDSKHNLWIGTWANGLYKYNLQTKEVVQYTKEKNGLGSNNIFQIVEGKPGELWLCTFWGGLTQFNIDKQSSVTYNVENSDLADNDLRTMAKDYNGNLWIGTDMGLSFFNPVTKFFKSYQHREEDKKSLSKGFVSYIKESSDSTLWIGTTGGLDKFDRKTDSFIHYNTHSGLSSDEIMCIIEDENGILWISTNRGISKFDPKTEVFKNYDVSDGLQGNEFNTRSGYKTKRGEIIFGGNNGFNIFQPVDMKYNSFVPPVVISDLKIFNKPVSIGGSDSPLKKNISETKKLTLSYKQSVFSFSFVALNYICPEKNHYAYMMEGFDSDWNYIGTNRSATYTNLDPGIYVFKVKASNNDGVWNNKGASLLIEIEPPFWKTWWAYLIESLILLLIVYLILNYFISRQRLRNALQIEHLELEKMYELDQMKTHFFSNISHEFQSPMSLILGPLEKLIASYNIEEKIKNSLTLVHRNARRLQRMANQLQDFNKLETGDLQLFLSKGDIIHFIKEISISFHDFAKDRHIEFQFKSNPEQYIAWFDPDKVDKIIYNLLSNAFKFTPEYGKIIIEADIIKSKNNPEVVNEKDRASKYVVISVKDSGIGIPQDKIEHIFKRYYHLDGYDGKRYEGSGVGLAFVYELLKLYKGDISVESQEDHGTTFTVQIPIDEHYLEENQLVEKFNISSNNHGSFAETRAHDHNNGSDSTRTKIKFRDVPVILIVEDDKEIRDYIKNSFDINYRVIEAENGMLGCKKAMQIIPDLIITDIKMREMDGIELCGKLKNDEKTSHIPIIMLTGVTSQEYQLKGLAEGADVYLTKPFNIDVVEAHMINLLDSRRKLQEKFSREFILGPNKIAINDIDAGFLKRLTDMVEANISDSKFNADVLSAKIGMSRMQLYRKLRGLTNQTVHEFIRNIRLKRAVQLLEQKKMTITEVAYEVGFNDLTYFARCFRKQYEKSPSEYISNKD